MPFVENVVLILIAALLQTVTQLDRSRIEVISTGKYMPPGQVTNFDGGPVIGNMLNFHYFPGLNFYNGGRYKEAEKEFNYVLLRGTYLDGNPRQAEYLSTAYYMRGMIYLYHARGLGRQTIALQDFEASVKWNPNNYIVYLEMSHLYAGLGFNDQAVAILHHLQSLNPDEETAGQAEKELDAITQKLPQQPAEK